MSLLGAVAVDFAEQLKKKAKAWAVAPLATGNTLFPKSGGFLFVKPRSNNKSPTQHFIENRLDSDYAFIQIKQQGRPLRLIGLRLDPVKCLIHLSFWRASGYVKREESVRDFRYARWQRYNECPEGYNSLILCRMHHTTRVNKKKEVNWHYFDLTTPEPPAQIVDVVITVIDKSFQWLGRGKFEKFGRYQHPVMIDLNGKNYTTDERFGGDWLS